MNIKSPLGANYGWAVSQDHYYSPRDLDQDAHDGLAVFAALNDLELMKVEKTLGYEVILALLLGKYTLHLRIYKKKDVIERPDKLPSKLLHKDPATFLMFNEQNALEIIEGDLRERAQGHTPTFYAARLLSPQRREQLAAMDCQLNSIPMNKVGLPKTDKPLENDGWVEVIFSDGPPLEPDT